jgi:hypothetical protein
LKCRKTPKITKNSRRIVDQKNHLPLWNSKRLSSEQNLRKQNLEKIKQKMREDEDSRRDSGGYFRKCSSMRSIDSKIGGGETSLQSNEKGRNGPPLSLLTNKKESN